MMNLESLENLVSGAGGQLKKTARNGLLSMAAMTTLLGGSVGLNGCATGAIPREYGMSRAEMAENGQLEGPGKLILQNGAFTKSGYVPTEKVQAVDPNANTDFPNRVLTQDINNLVFHTLGGGRYETGITQGEDVVYVTGNSNNEEDLLHTLGIINRILPGGIKGDLETDRLKWETMTFPEGYLGDASTNISNITVVSDPSRDWQFNVQYVTVEKTGLFNAGKDAPLKKDLKDHKRTDYTINVFMYDGAQLSETERAQVEEIRRKEATNDFVYSITQAVPGAFIVDALANNYAAGLTFGKSVAGATWRLAKFATKTDDGFKHESASMREITKYQPDVFFVTHPKHDADMVETAAVLGNTELGLAHYDRVLGESQQSTANDPNFEPLDLDAKHVASLLFGGYSQHPFNEAVNPKRLPNAFAISAVDGQYIIKGDDGRNKPVHGRTYSIDWHTLEGVGYKTGASLLKDAVTGLAVDESVVHRTRNRAVPIPIPYSGNGGSGGGVIGEGPGAGRF